MHFHKTSPHIIFDIKARQFTSLSGSQTSCIIKINQSLFTKKNPKLRFAKTRFHAVLRRFRVRGGYVGICMFVLIQGYALLTLD